MSNDIITIPGRIGLGRPTILTLPEGMSEVNAYYALFRSAPYFKADGAVEKVAAMLINRNFFVVIRNTPIVGFFKDRQLILFNYDALNGVDAAKKALSGYADMPSGKRFEKGDVIKLPPPPSSCAKL